ncbi:hypothetical protein KAR48_03325 [bacterium]|nr:hypothetical protein [bacterium]
MGLSWQSIAWALPLIMFFNFLTLEFMLMPSSDVEKIQIQLQPVFKKYQGQILFAYCFGSTVTGERSMVSDTDLAFYVNSVCINLEFRLQLIADCMRALKCNKVDVIILNTLQNLVLADTIVCEGVILCDSDLEMRHQYEISIRHSAFDFLAQRKAVMGI